MQHLLVCVMNCRQRCRTDSCARGYIISTSNSATGATRGASRSEVTARSAAKTRRVSTTSRDSPRLKQPYTAQ
eukprot:2768-Heterococcus_DN1.PRE.4